MNYEQPHEIDSATFAFPASLGDLLPPLSEIPEKYSNPNIAFNSDDKWVRFQSDWFFQGLPENKQPNVKPGIDAEKAWRHLRAIQGSYEPKHKHKVAAVAWLASLWFEDYPP